MIPTSYEDEDILNTYLLFHYGSESQQLGESFKASVFGSSFIESLSSASQYASRSVSSMVDATSLGDDSRALDVGCSVGRSTFELASLVGEAVGVDYSQTFIHAAEEMKAGKQISCKRQEQGARLDDIILQAPFGDSILKKTVFIAQDAETLSLDDEHLESGFDVIFAANLLCRLPNPSLFIDKATALLRPGGQLVLCSPYSWIDSFTPEKNWIGANETQSSEDALKELICGKGLELEFECEIPFLIREHSRKFQLSIAHGTRFRKKS